MEPLQKPVVSIQRLIDACRPFGDLLDAAEVDTLIDLYGENGEKRVIMVMDGVLSINRNSDHLLYAVVTGPTFLGVLATEYRREIFSFTALKGCHFMTIDREKVIELVTRYGLVKELLDYYAYIIDYQANHSAKMLNRSTYEIICTLLTELQCLPEDKRHKISVTNYIISRTHFARSGVMKIISDLRLGGYVDIRNGKLFNILKKFPVNY